MGKTALVTGASRGIGRAIALSLAARGANLIIWSRQELPLHSVKQEIENYGSICNVVVGDLANNHETETKFAKMRASFGKVDVLINNAGTIQIAASDNASEEGWNQVMSVNLGAALTLCQLALKDMTASGWGRIINISSISGSMGEAFAIAYAVSKAALNGVTSPLAVQAAKFGVTVNAICPGWVETEMAINQLKNDNWCKLNGIDPDDSIEIARFSSPQERFIQPAEIGELVSFLCSNRANSITGQCLTVCGGLSLS